MKIDNTALVCNKTTYKFLPENILKDRKYSLYLYVEEVDSKFFAKFGEAKEQSCFDRYAATGMTQNKRMIKVWESTKGDKEIHRVLKMQSSNKHGFIWAGTKDECPLNTSEAYLIQTEDGLETLISFIEDEVKTVSPRPESREPWADVKQLVDDIVAADVEHYNLDLCPRWGKTGTMLLLMKELAEKKDIRINIMTSYVGTVRTSYMSEICAIVQNSNCKFFDPDNYEDPEELVVKMKEWLKDPKHYAMYYVALTGTYDEDNDEYVEADDETCFDRRIAALLKLKKFGSMMTVEESDFGAHCAKQIKKLRQLYSHMNCKKFIATTGTNACKNEKIFMSEKYIKRDYLLDVLNSSCRPNAVKIHWHALNNAGMVEAGFKSCGLENFSSMFEVVDGHLREEMYFESLFTWLFKPGEATFLKSCFRKKVPIDRDAATIIFTAGGLEAHKALKKLLELMLPDSYRIQIIDGTTTTNADAEAKAKACFKKQDNNHVIFIASNMANRSFSVPQIKNVILLMNDGSYSSISQKIARGLTPWCKEHDVCNIVDFRMNYASNDENLAKYVSQLGIDALNNHLLEDNEDRVISAIEASDKIIFDEYFGAGQMPIQTIDSEKLRCMMQSRDFMVAKCQIVYDEIAVKVKEPDICELHEVDNSITKLLNCNVKGDGGKKMKVSGRMMREKSEQEEEAEQEAYDKKRQHLLFLLNYPERFNTYRFNKDILKNEFDDMSTERKAAYREAFGFDMTTMKQIVDLLHERNVVIL